MQRRVALGVTAMVGVHYVTVSFIDVTYDDLRGPSRGVLSAVTASSGASVSQIFDTTLNGAAYDARPYRDLNPVERRSL